MKSNAEKLAEFLGSNKMRGESLWRLTQVFKDTPTHPYVTEIQSDISASYQEIFGEQAPWDK